MLAYMRKLIRENRRLRQQNADLTGALMETTSALVRSTARNVQLGQELQRSTATIRELIG